jgi:hypothetical protein
MALDMGVSGGHGGPPYIKGTYLRGAAEGFWLLEAVMSQPNPRLGSQQKGGGSLIRKMWSFGNPMPLLVTAFSPDTREGHKR